MSAPVSAPVTELVSEVGRMRGMFFMSHHPWIGVVVLIVLVGLVLVLNQRNQRR